ncbi:unknown [Clostridium sp. CAG:594]|nr:unknown [Clostridium sp. CAG:594]
MSKLLNSVLDRVSENNNEYRSILRALNSTIDEVTTSLVGDVVTLSSYTADFSNTLSESKEKLVNPISRIIESYVIKDLRSVETVNEQFVEKINDKLENADIKSKEEKDSFANSLNNLLNDKYLEIVKIKRIDFFNPAGVNENIEETIDGFVSYLNGVATFNQESLNTLINDYKSKIYKQVKSALEKISNLYLNNFVSEVSSSLNAAIDYDNDSVKEEVKDDFKPFIPDINPIPEAVVPDAPIIPEIPEVPVMPEVKEQSDNISEINTEDEEKKDDNFSLDIPSIPEVTDVKPVTPVEIKEEPSKRPYDVEEILKIAKSPIVSMPEMKKEEPISTKDEFVPVSPITEEKETETMESEFNEKEIVEEMIRRLTNRLNDINERTSKYESEKEKLEEDESFVNDLIKSSNDKKEELDKFESELDAKEKELDERQKELDKKINDVMPFANAVLKSEE